MIIYNVTVKVLPQIADEWLRWMHEEHMPELLVTGLFTDYRLCRLLEQDESEGITFSAQYFSRNMEQYQRYLAEYAPLMRQKGYDRFGDKFIAFRTVMKVEFSGSDHS